MALGTASLARAGASTALVLLSALLASSACSSGDDFTEKGSGGSSGSSTGGTNTGGTAGDAATTGGAGGTSGGAGGSSGSNTGGVGGNPNGKDNGNTCGDSTECKSGYCTDGVCCESDCPGACKSCALSGKEGLCTPYPEDTDPDAECVGAGAPTDPCAGTCDGKGACSYPDPAKTCGASTCTGATQHDFACDSGGACAQKDTSCGNYVCGSASCLLSCSKDEDCASTAYCDTAAHLCKPKNPNGTACTGGNQCTSGTCATGFCCASACSAPSSCSTGTCLCAGTACDPGQACVTFYQDFDADNFGNPTVTKLSCANKKPTGYVLDKTDCYDNNANAKPGQTGFFPTHRGDGSFDYNCDNNPEKQYPVVSTASCKVCGWPNICPTPLVPPCTAGSFGCGSPVTCPTYNFGFTSDVACGVKTTAKKCDQQVNFQPPSTFTCGTSASVVDVLDVTQGCR